MLPCMNTTSTETPRRRITQDELPSLLVEFDESDLSVAAFARARGLRASPLYRAIQEREAGTSPPSPSPDFAPIRVIGPSASSTAFTVELLSGDKLTVQPDFDDSALGRLLSVLRTC